GVDVRDLRQRGRRDRAPARRRGDPHAPAAGGRRHGLTLRTRPAGALETRAGEMCGPEAAVRGLIADRREVGRSREDRPPPVRTDLAPRMAFARTPVTGASMLPSTPCDGIRLPALSDRERPGQRQPTEEDPQCHVSAWPPSRPRSPALFFED